MRATFIGTCHLCHDRILPGQEIAKHCGDYVHASCATARWGE